jgi:membrane-bound lytic murein transglycosylase D
MLANGIRNRNRIRAGTYLVIPTAVKGMVTPDMPEAARTDEGLVYTVKRGDTLWGISRAFGVNLNDLRRWNAGRVRRSGRDLKPGDKILVRVNGSPEGLSGTSGSREVRYIVRRGDSLWEVARRYKVTVDDIKRRNNLRGSRIDPGDQLVIPTR